jgi:hypothetical protein
MARRRRCLELGRRWRQRKLFPPHGIGFGQARPARARFHRGHLALFQSNAGGRCAGLPLLALGVGGCSGATPGAADSRGAVKTPWIGTSLGFGAVAEAATTPGMEYGGVKGAVPPVSMAGDSERWRRARGEFSASDCPSRARCGFLPRAGARAAYLVRAIVQNDAR